MWNPVSQSDDCLENNSSENFPTCVVDQQNHEYKNVANLRLHLAGTAEGCGEIFHKKILECNDLLPKNSANEKQLAGKFFRGEFSTSQIARTYSTRPGVAL
jgi:hypothetical protein